MSKGEHERLSQLRDPRTLHTPGHGAGKQLQGPEQKLQSSLEYNTRSGESGPQWRPKQPAFFVLNDVVECPVPVFGQIPKGFLKRVVQPSLQVARDDILHVCSGALRERLTVDIRPETKPWVVADGCNLPFADNTFEAAFLDPPYTPAWARNYGTKYPPTYPLIREAVRVVKPGGRIGVFHFLVPYSPKGTKLVSINGVSVGMGYQMRAYTVFRKDVVA